MRGLDIGRTMCLRCIMKAAVFRNVGQPLSIEEVTDPEPRSNELILKVKACGICGTDLHMSENIDDQGGWRLLEPGCVLGHEFSGEVVEVGKGVKDIWSLGDRVTALPWIGCGSCQDCVSGRPYRCPTVLIRGTKNLSGAYAQYSRIGSNEAVKLPDSVSFIEGALIEPLAVGYNAVKRAKIGAEEPVLIIGVGPVGLAVTMWCQFFGIQHVFVSDLLEKRALAALHYGAKHIVLPDQEDMLKLIKEKTGTIPKIVFDCVGVPGSFQNAINCVSPGGRVVVVGLCMSQDQYFPAKALLKELEILFAYVYCYADFEIIANLLGGSQIDVTPFANKSVSLTEFSGAFEQLKKPNDQLKVMLEMD